MVTVTPLFGKKVTISIKQAMVSARTAIEAPDLETMPEEINRVLNENAILAAANPEYSQF